TRCDFGALEPGPGVVVGVDRVEPPQEAGRQAVLLFVPSEGLERALEDHSSEVPKDGGDRCAHNRSRYAPWEPCLNDRPTCPTAASSSTAPTSPPKAGPCRASTSSTRRCWPFSTSFPRAKSLSSSTPPSVTGSIRRSWPSSRRPSQRASSYHLRPGPSAGATRFSSGLPARSARRCCPTTPS